MDPEWTPNEGDRPVAPSASRGHSPNHGYRHATVDQLLDEARGQIERLSPVEAEAAAYAGAVLIEIRSDDQGARDGTIPAAAFIPGNVLEWRLDPASHTGIPRAPGAILD